MRGRVLLAVGALLLALASGALLVRGVTQRSDADASDRQSCSEVIPNLVDEVRSVREKIPYRVADARPGWELVEVAPRAAGTWRFVDDGSGVRRGVRAEGVFSVRGSGRVTGVDILTVDPAEPAGEARHRERLVIIDDRIWIEDAKYPARLSCEIEPYQRSLLVRFEDTVGAMPFLDRLAKGGRDWQAPNISPGARVLARVVGTEVVDGVVMTTYEQHPVERYEQIRTRFTVDPDRQLRSAEAVDTTTAKTLYRRTARPDPSHPGIEDPTGEPIISMNP